MSSAVDFAQINEQKYRKTTVASAGASFTGSNVAAA